MNVMMKKGWLRNNLVSDLASSSGPRCVVGLLLLVPLRTEAQPMIATQPRHLSVLFGETATFQVRARGEAGLSYQWQFNSADIPGATGGEIVIDNVARSNLGLYAVVVSDSTGEVFSHPAVLKSARWTELVYFGSSEGMSQFSNGPSWIDRLADWLGIARTHYHNYATGGAGNVDVASQITSYLSAQQPSERTLVAFWTGGPGLELLQGRSLSNVASAHIANIQRMIDAGGRGLLIPRIWPAEVTPQFRASFPNLMDETLLEFDRALDEEIEHFKQTYAITVVRPDMFEFFGEVWASPETYGFTDLNRSAQSSLGDDDAFFWWDGVHFTRAAHEVVSRQIYHHLTPPTRLEPPNLGNDDIVELRWTGGHAPFLVQQRTTLGVGSWETIGALTDEHEASAPASENSKRRAFFRIVPLGQ